MNMYITWRGLFILGLSLPYLEAVRCPCNNGGTCVCHNGQLCVCGQNVTSCLCNQNCQPESPDINYSCACQHGYVGRFCDINRRNFILRQRNRMLTTKYVGTSFRITTSTYNTTTDVDDDDDDHHSDSNDSAMPIVYIFIGALVIAVIIVSVIICCLCKKQKTKHSDKPREQVLKRQHVTDDTCEIPHDQHHVTDDTYEIPRDQYERPYAETEFVYHPYLELPENQTTDDQTTVQQNTENEASLQLNTITTSMSQRPLLPIPKNNNPKTTGLLNSSFRYSYEEPIQSDVNPQTS